jgi:hypothetical protein
MFTTLECLVQDLNGTYTTNQVRGCRASATMNARSAAESLGRKLFGPSFGRVDEVHEGTQYTTRWVITADPTHYASVSPSGRVDFGPVVPVLNTKLASGPANALHQIVGNALAGCVLVGADLDHDSGGEPWLPGVYEGMGRASRDEVVLDWLKEQAAALKPKHSLGVVYATSIHRAVL